MFHCNAHRRYRPGVRAWACPARCHLHAVHDALLSQKLLFDSSRTSCHDHGANVSGLCHPLNAYVHKFANCPGLACEQARLSLASNNVSESLIILFSL
jgi:hypothetical protein